MDNKNNLVPNQLAASVFTAFLTLLFVTGTAILYLLMIFCIFRVIAFFLQKEVTIGFLLSVYGMPIIGATVIAFFELIKEKIKAV